MIHKCSKEERERYPHEVETNIVLSLSHARLLPRTDAECRPPLFYAMAIIFTTTGRDHLSTSKVIFNFI